MHLACWSYFLLAIALLTNCSSKSDPSGPTSAEGKWTYTTPDGKISVDFDLVKTTSGSLDLQNPAIKVNSTSGAAAGQLTGVSLPDISMIKINANDAVLVYPYSITFSMAKVTGDFKTIVAANVDYTYPWGTTKSLTTVTIFRK